MENKKQEKYTKEKLNNIFSQHALNVLYTFEGHDETNSGTKEKILKHNPPTTYYGLTDKSVAQILMLNKNKYDIPKYLNKKTKLWDLSKQQCREIAQLFAAYHYDKIKTTTNSLAIDQLDQRVKEAVLMELHRIGFDDFEKSYKDPSKPYGTLKMIVTGDNNRVMKSLLTDGYGNPYSEISEGKAGDKNRVLGTLKYAYDKANLKKLDTKQGKDALYSTQEKTPDLIKTSIKCLDTIISYDDKNRQACLYSDIDQDRGLSMAPKKEESSEGKQPKTETTKTETPKKEGFFNKLVNNITNKFNVMKESFGNEVEEELAEEERRVLQRTDEEYADLANELSKHTED